MGVQVAGACLQWSPNSAAHSRAALGYRKRQDAVDRAPFLVPKLPRSRSLEIRWGRGWRGEERTLRRAASACLQPYPGDGDEEEHDEELFELGQRQQGEAGGEEPSARCERGEALHSSANSSSESRKQEPSIEPPWLPLRPDRPDWHDQIVPASVEKNANSVELPFSLRFIKRKKRRAEGWVREAGESACCSAKRAFSSMVFMLRELQSYALQMREVLFSEDLQGILARVQREMDSSFVWVFQQIFYCTPTLMVSVMLLLANFAVYSMDHLDVVAMAAPSPPAQSLVETVAVDDHRQVHHDRSSVKAFSSTGRTASIGGNGSGGGGGKAKAVAGDTGDWRSDDGSLSDRRIPRFEGALLTEEEARVWQRILEEAWGMQATARHEALMDPETLRCLVSPVTVEVEPDDEYADYVQTEIMYQQALMQEPENALLLLNFAQFLYLVVRDHDRAEYYFKRAAGLKPADAEALSRYASFMWEAKKDLEAAEEAYLEALAADPGNTVHTANYAHFLWSTGGEDTCYPLDGNVAA